MTAIRRDHGHPKITLAKPEPSTHDYYQTENAPLDGALPDLAARLRRLRRAAREQFNG